ncbi:MAG: polymer-forming cytoskeletal protein [Candidatus Aminicenantaceae bacterium]
MMNKKIFCLAILFLFFGLIPLQGQGFVFKKDIVVEEGETQDNIISLGGEIRIEGTVTDSVINFGGTIIIEGEVEKTVVGFGSDIILKSTARIQGDVLSLGGTLDKDPGAIIKGDTVYFSTSDEVSKFFKEGFAGVFGFSVLPLLIIFRLITLVIWFILAIILVTIFPKQISFASNQIRTSFWPIFGTGILSIIIFTGLIIFSVFLCFILIGIPILLALAAIGIVIKIFGRVVIFYFLGDWIFKAFGGKQASGLLAVILGLLLFGLLGFIPVIGSLFSFVLSIIGWGVVIRTKFGSAENWFKRK